MHWKGQCQQKLIRSRYYFHQIESNANDLIQIEIEIEDAFVDLHPNGYFWQKAKIY